MTTVAMNRTLLIEGNNVVGIGEVTFRESLGCWTKFTDLICCSTRNWRMFHTNLGIRHIDVQDDDLRKRLEAIYNPPTIALQHRPVSPAKTVNLSLDIYDETRLHRCSKFYMSAKAKGDPVAIEDALNAVRKIVAYGGDPFLATNDGVTSFAIANNDLALIKVLTRTEHIKAFDHCKDIHDFWDVVYPPSTKELPKGHEQWIQLLSQSSLAERLQKILPREEIEAFPPLEAIIEELRKEEQKKLRSLTAVEIVDHLRVNYPAFETVCKQFGSNFPKIIEVPSSYFGIHRVHLDGNSALYQAETHTIHIEETRDLRLKFEKLFYEMMNALQKEGFEKLSQLMMSEDTRFSREGYSFLMEYLEYGSARAFDILVPKVLPTEELLDSWIAVNLPFHDGLVPRAFHFRRLWDIYCAWPYISDHRAEFQARLKELSQL